MPLRRLLPCALLALALVPAAPAAADQAIAEIARQSPVAAYGGWQAWSRYDDATHRYTLMLQAPGQPAAAARLSSSSRPFDVSLGPDANQNVVAVYQRCGSSGCDVRRYNAASGSDAKLSTVSSPSYDEATPAIWGSTVVFTRRVHGCDVPYVKNLSSSASSRRLLKSKCLQTDPGQASIRGSRIIISSVDTSGADSNGAGIKVAELRKYSSSVQRLAGARQAELRRGVQLLRPGGPGRSLRLHGARRHPPGQHVRAHLVLGRQARGGAAPFARSPPRSPSRARTPRSTSSPRVARRPRATASRDVPCRIVLARRSRSAACSAR